MSATTTPERSYEQRITALVRANGVRSRRAQMKRELKDGSLSVLALLADPPPWLETVKVSELLLSVPRYGRVGVRRVLRRAELSPDRTLGNLSERQRRVLSTVMGSG